MGYTVIPPKNVGNMGSHGSFCEGQPFLFTLAVVVRVFSPRSYEPFNWTQPHCSYLSWQPLGKTLRILLNF